MKNFLMACGLSLAAMYGTAIFGKNKVAPASHAELAPQVSLTELKQLVDTKAAIIIDANGKSTYSEGHIPGALSFAKYEGKLAQILPKDKQALIVAYCGGPLCTAWEEAAKEAKKDGYTNIKHFKGGIKGWKEASLPLEKIAPNAG